MGGALGGALWSCAVATAVLGLSAASAGGAVSADEPAIAVGRTVLLAPRVKDDGCRRGPLPDRRCSPGAYYRNLTRTVLCSPTFRTSEIRHVPQSEKAAVEREYGMEVRPYGRALEIDHIVSLELGGSNAIANLFPESGSGVWNYHLKDKLENRLHKMVCESEIGLRAAQIAIARNWRALYTKVYGG
jgi:hypothetical protein